MNNFFNKLSIVQASYTKTGMSNELTSQARTLVDALQNFQQSLFEITLEVTPQKLLLRNYVDVASGKSSLQFLTNL